MNRLMEQARHFSLVLVMVMTAKAVMAEKVEVPLPALSELRLDLAAPGTRIVHPVTGEYPAIAQRLAKDLGALTGKAPAVVAEADPAAMSGPGPLLVLGNLMDSTVVRRLYFEAYDFTDYAFPGPGGYTLRTIRDPFGTGAPVLLVSGSDAAGVSAAAARLVERVRSKARGWAM